MEGSAEELEEGGESSWVVLNREEHRPPPLTSTTRNDDIPILLDTITEQASSSAPEMELETEDELMSLMAVGDDADETTATLTIPSIAFEYRLADLPAQMREIIALKLDLHPAGTAHNWELLAALLGLSLDHIRWLRERPSHSPTIQLMLRFPDVTLHHLLRLLRDNLHRLDVFIELLPLVHSLPSVAHPQSAKHNRDTQDSGISGPLNDDHPGPSHRGNYEQHRVQRSLFDLGLRPSVEAPLVHRANGVHSQPRPPGPDGQKEFLVTFYPDDAHHEKFVRWLCKNLRTHGATVINEDKLLINAATDLCGVLAATFNRVTQVIVVYSDKYVQYCTAAANDNDATQQRALSCRYLYRLMESEYMTNSCINYRFRPVLFPHVPTSLIPCGWARNTIVYSWPAQNDQLCRMLFESSAAANNSFDLSSSDTTTLQST